MTVFLLYVFFFFYITLVTYVLGNIKNTRRENQEQLKAMMNRVQNEALHRHWR